MGLTTVQRCCAACDTAIIVTENHLSFCLGYHNIACKHLVNVYRFPVNVWTDRRIPISKFCSEGFHRLTDWRVVWKISWNLADGNLWNHVLLPWQKKIKFRIALQLSLLRKSRSKSSRSSPRQRVQSAQDFIQIGSLSVELQPNAWTPPKRAVKWILYSAEAYLWAE